MDARRHSVDLPISRTLVALRRVRSLRDPSTNSMSKLSALANNSNWETKSNNASTSGFDSTCIGGSGYDVVSMFRNSSLFTANEQHLSDHELFYSSRHCESGLIGETILTQLKKRGRIRPKRKNWNRKHNRFSRVTASDVLSCVGSPCLSMSDLPNEGSSSGITLYGSEDDSVLESGYGGCGINSCWSKTLKIRESNLQANVEELPLMLTDKNVGYGHDRYGFPPFLETPRSLCQKFMPKTFKELVGQNVVARSLLSEISNSRIASMYLFHGPRGVGKTSAARVFAAALNCLSPEIDKPCGLCQDCVLFFSGKSGDVREIDSATINRKVMFISLIKNADVPLFFSRFKVYVIDECNLLQGETWTALLKKLEELPQHIVFIMVTPDLNNLPCSIISKSKTYHFQTFTVVDIASLLAEICGVEGLEFDDDALNFIASKSNGSLREATTMLDQLTLLGKKITMSLVHEVNGFVADDELLDLLQLALSFDASNTVKSARELMRSRIDPLQLTSQLSNLIMDILAGKCEKGVCELKLTTRELSHALQVLSEAEKQLRMSNNQTTWLTAALLQLGSASHEDNLRLSSRSHSQGVAVAELEFDHPKYVSKAEKFWKEIACALQCMLGCNIELKINLASNASNKYGKFKKPSFRLFGSSCRMQYCAECGDNASENLSYTPTTSITGNRFLETCSSDCESKILHKCCRGKDIVTSIRNADGNSLSVRMRTPHIFRSERQDQLWADSLNNEINDGCSNSIDIKPQSRSRRRERWKLHCWRTTIFPCRKTTGSYSNREEVAA
ncbi:Replication factor C, subunit RFC4 [Handroanthus impetiginosus]|uniref:Replication factor C, subunit RFC4 n=1 Tax=Handroanthus impetiginosus TaxID=429701 RepID=A0A2G9HL97_9LAMI|nr:Replication factor C, subunit RFC4 [Handroanthus impetiginosus]